MRCLHREMQWTKHKSVRNLETTGRSGATTFPRSGQIQTSDVMANACWGAALVDKRERNMYVCVNAKWMYTRYRSEGNGPVAPL